jgi:hypothetical protein
MALQRVNGVFVAATARRTMFFCWSEPRTAISSVLVSRFTLTLPGEGCRVVIKQVKANLAAGSQISMEGSRKDSEIVRRRQ